MIIWGCCQRQKAQKCKETFTNYSCLNVAWHLNYGNMILIWIIQ